MFEFSIADNHQNLTRFSLEEGEYSLGKGEDSDIVLHDTHASRLHGKLNVSKQGVTYTDCQSTNGTWMRGARITESIFLKMGDVLGFGELQLSVLAVPEAEVKPTAVVMGISEFMTQDRTGVKSLVRQESETLISAKRKIHSLILEYLDLRKRNNLEGMSVAELRSEAEKATRDIISDHITQLPTEISAEELCRQVVAEAVGLGALEPLLDDDSISEIMVNGCDQIYVERNGRLELAESRFTSDQSLLAIIDRVVSPIGRRIDESSPMVDARLPDGSRVNAIIPPLALNGPTITIRKFSRQQLFIDDLLKFGSVSLEVARFLKAAVELKQSILISGGTGSGKTTLLNILSNFIGPEERIVTIEDAAELRLNQPHVVALESRPANAEGKGKISIRDLVINALRMRPDRIVVGECRGGEALDMLQAMNTGHDGSMTTGHANSPADFLNRLEVMVMMAGVDLPSRAIREQVASAVDIIVQQNRLADGTRKITQVMEVNGMSGDHIDLQPIFEYVKKGNDNNGKIVGEYQATGYIPQFYRTAMSQGIKLDVAIFNEPEINIEEAAQTWN